MGLRLRLSAKVFSSQYLGCSHGSFTTVSNCSSLTVTTVPWVCSNELYAAMQGSWIVNNARGAIVNVDDIKEACESGQLGGECRPA